MGRVSGTWWPVADAAGMSRGHAAEWIREYLGQHPLAGRKPKRDQLNAEWAARLRSRFRRLENP
jgi:hypothetical protein